MIGKRIGAVALLLAGAGCAPPEAGYALSERAAQAPSPVLLPSSAFDAPRAEGAAAARGLESGRAALDARAAALRRRAAALSAHEPIAPEDRARLQEARPGG